MYVSVFYANITPFHELRQKLKGKNIFHIQRKRYLNLFAFYIFQNSTYPRIFRLFRALGLRHVTVIDDKHRVSKKKKKKIYLFFC